MTFTHRDPQPIRKRQIHFRVTLVTCELGVFSLFSICLYFIISLNILGCCELFGSYNVVCCPRCRPVLCHGLLLIHTIDVKTFF